MTDSPPASPTATAIDVRSRPRVVDVVSTVWGGLMLAGVFAAGLQLLEFLGWLGGGGGFSNLEFGASLGSAGSGYAVWKGLREGRRTSWVTLRRISWVAGFGFTLATAILIFVDPSSITLSGPTGEMDLEPEQRGLAIGLAAAGAGAFLAQAIALGRRNVRDFFHPTDQAQPGA